MPQLDVLEQPNNGSRQSLLIARRYKQSGTPMINILRQGAYRGCNDWFPERIRDWNHAALSCTDIGQDHHCGTLKKRGSLLVPYPGVANHKPIRVLHQPAIPFQIFPFAGNRDFNILYLFRNQRFSSYEVIKTLVTPDPTKKEYRFLVFLDVLVPADISDGHVGDNFNPVLRYRQLPVNFLSDLLSVHNDAVRPPKAEVHHTLWSSLRLRIPHMMPRIMDGQDQRVTP